MRGIKITIVTISNNLTRNFFELSNNSPFSSNLFFDNNLRLLFTIFNINYFQ